MMAFGKHLLWRYDAGEWIVETCKHMLDLLVCCLWRCCRRRGNQAISKILLLQDRLHLHVSNFPTLLAIAAEASAPTWHCYLMPTQSRPL